MKGRVSIVITSFNYARFLPEAIESALAQTYRDIEVIVIDDGSGDDSVAVASRYDIHLLVQENQGVGAARNNATAVASGEYVLFLDADDRLFPHSVEHLVDRIRTAGDDTGYAYGQMQYFDTREGLFASREFDAAALARENFIGVTSLFRREALLRIGCFDRGFRLREDWELYVRLLHAGLRGAFLAEPVLHYRKHKEPTRKKTSRPKKIALTRLEYLYPRFFLRSILRNPLRHLYYRWRFHIGPDIRQYGPSEKPPRQLK